MECPFRHGNLKIESKFWQSWITQMSKTDEYVVFYNAYCDLLIFQDIINNLVGVK